jgi:hypothetical protein
LATQTAHPHVLADVVEEHLTVGAVAAQRHRRVGLERPGLDLAAAILHVHEEYGCGFCQSSLVSVPVNSRHFLLSHSAANEWCARPPAGTSSDEQRERFATSTASRAGLKACRYETLFT